MADSKIAKDEAFGIVPILYEDNRYQFLLIQHNAGHWGFPKGHADPGESDLQAACREFVEETGITDCQVIQGPLFSERYTFTRRGQRFEKTVIYFAALVESATVQCQQEEIQDSLWADYEKALSLLSFNGSKQVLYEVHQYLSNHPLA